MENKITGPYLIFISVVAFAFIWRSGYDLTQIELFIYGIAFYYLGKDFYKRYKNTV